MQSTVTSALLSARFLVCMAVELVLQVMALFNLVWYLIVVFYGFCEGV